MIYVNIDQVNTTAKHTKILKSIRTGPTYFVFYAKGHQMKRRVLFKRQKINIEDLLLQVSQL